MYIVHGMNMIEFRFIFLEVSQSRGLQSVHVLIDIYIFPLKFKKITLRFFDQSEYGQFKELTFSNSLTFRFFILIKLMIFHIYFCYRKIMNHIS